MSTSALAAVDFGQGLSDAWRAVITFVPKLVGFLLILVIGFVIAKFLAKVVDKVLERVGFDRVVERGGVKRALERSKYDASDLIAKLVYYAVLLITLQIAFGVWGPNPVSALLTGIVAWLPRAAVAIIIVVVAAAIAKAVKDVVGNALGGLSYGHVVATTASIFIIGLGVIAALNQIGVATAVTTPVLITVLATIGGIAVIGVGGGLVRPMQQRWERWLSKAEQEIPQARAHAAAYQRGREDAARAANAPTEQVPANTPAQQVPANAPARPMPADGPTQHMPASGRMTGQLPPTGGPGPTP